MSTAATGVVLMVMIMMVVMPVIVFVA